MEKPLLAVWMLTYNHEKYIWKVIDSVLMQKTDFNYKLYIGEDCSTDNTREVVVDLKKKHPDKIELLLNEKNNIVKNSLNTYNACFNSGAKYIALLEGDDYWTDSCKLQKQVDFLEANPAYGLVYSDIKMIDEDNKEIQETHFFKVFKTKYKSGNVFFDLLEGNFINTLTVCTRRELLFDYFKKYPNEWFMYDYRLWLHISALTKIKFINEKSAAYRIHNSGISESKGFFDKRIQLTKQSALVHYFSTKANKERKNKIIGRVLLEILLNLKLTKQEKQPAISLVFKEKPVLIFYLIQAVLFKAWKKLNLR